MSSLPNEIIVDILTRLPVKSLLRFRCVCKSWHTIITSSNFINSHLDRAIQISNLSLFFKSGPDFRYLCSPINFQSPNLTLELRFPFHDSSPLSGAEISGSCNGLICLSNVPDNIFLVNPSTRSYIQLPEPPAHYPGFSVTDLGFGYSPLTHEYKVLYVRAYPLGSGFELYRSEVNVYTLGTNSWKRIADIYIKIGNISTGILLNGSLHWIVERGVDNNAGGSNSSFSVVIAAFGIGTEEFRYMPMPELDEDKYAFPFLGTLRDSLCVSCHRQQNTEVWVIEVWVMMEYGVKESWALQFNIRHPKPGFFQSINHFQPFGCLRNGKILLMRNDGKLVMYDPRTECTRDLMVAGLGQWFETIDYVETLVSVEG